MNTFNEFKSPAYDVYVSQLIWYDGESICIWLFFFLSRGKLITNKLPGFQKSRFKAAFRKRFIRYKDLVCPRSLL